MYGYANPVVFTDPSGFLPLLKFTEQSAYKRIETVTENKNGKVKSWKEEVTYKADRWTSADMAAAESTAQRVDQAFAQIINANYSILSRVYQQDCYRGYERYQNLPPITPGSAFLLVYREPVAWEKRGESVINEEDGKPCPEGKCAYAETKNRNLIYVWKNARDNYAVEHPGWVVHELGHAFELATVVYDQDGDLYRPGQTILRKSYSELLVRTSDEPSDPYAGFSGGFNDGQFSGQLTEGEVFADMFTGWVSNKWWIINNRISPMGQKRADFMNIMMPYLLRLVISK